MTKNIENEIALKGLKLEMTDNEIDHIKIKNIGTKSHIELESKNASQDLAISGEITRATEAEQAIVDAQEIINNYLDAEIKALQIKVYGIDINETTGDVIRTHDAIGKTVSAPNGVSAIVSGFDTLYPFSDSRHVKVSTDGVIKEQLEHDYAAFDGEIMTRIPQFYYKDIRYGGHRYCTISKDYVTGYSKAWQDKEYGLISSMGASLVSGEYRSRVDEAPKTITSYTNFITAFYAKGDGKWSMYDANMMHNLFLLTCIEVGSTNHKGSYGRGINSGMPYSSSANYLLIADTVNGNTVTLGNLGQSFYVGMIVQIGSSYTNNTVAKDRKILSIDTTTDLVLTLDGDAFSAVIGNAAASWGQSVPEAQFNIIGDGSGYIEQWGSVNRSHVCYRGIWDLWGNIWQFLAGFMRKDGQMYGCCDKLGYNITDPSLSTKWTDLGLNIQAANGYQRLREAIKIDGGSVDVPIEWGSVASSETFYSAYLYSFSAPYQGVRVLRVGGSWYNGGDVSLVCSSGILTPSAAYIFIGARLIRY